MFRLVDEQWDKQFAEASIEDADELRIICPFIKDGALKNLMRRKPRKIQVITRFNLADFAAGVSDVNALQRLLDAGATVRGVKNLHAKLYIFGESRAIITSANLTEAAMARNHELGVVSDNAKLVKKCYAYFNKLWKSAAGSDLDGEQLESWGDKVRQYQLGGGSTKDVVVLDDYGAAVGFTEFPLDRAPKAFDDASQAFVKFQGTSGNRLPLSARVFDVVKGSG